MEETIPNNPMEPDTEKELNESEMGEIVGRVTKSFMVLKSEYPHFNNFDTQTAHSRPNLIWYRNNIKFEPNPEYEKELNRRANLPPIKRPLPPEERPYYSEKDGIELFIEFTNYEVFRSSQQIWLPTLWLCNYAVKIKINGAKTKELKEIKDKVFEILKEVKKNVEW